MLLEISKESGLNQKGLKSQETKIDEKINDEKNIYMLKNKLTKFQHQYSILKVKSNQQKEKGRI